MTALDSYKCYGQHFLDPVAVHAESAVECLRLIQLSRALLTFAAGVYV